jgi:hypothetical protein
MPATKPAADKPSLQNGQAPTFMPATKPAAGTLASLQKERVFSPATKSAGGALASFQKERVFSAASTFASLKKEEP